MNTMRQFVRSRPMTAKEYWHLLCECRDKGISSKRKREIQQGIDSISKTDRRFVRISLREKFGESILNQFTF